MTEPARLLAEMVKLAGELHAVAERFARVCRRDGFHPVEVMASRLPDGDSERQEVTRPAAALNQAQDGLLMTYRQVADRLNVSERTVLRVVASGALTVVTIGGCRRVRQSDLESFVKGLE